MDAALLNERWKLAEVEGDDIRLSSFSFDRQSYIQFVASDSKLQGLSACDEIGGQFSLDAGSKTFTITQITVKPGSCSSPVFGVRYLAALLRTARYEVNNRELRLYDATQSTDPILTFRAEE
ncbi:hypothetical protein GCM10011375_19850 [Hymenobacter qilianensis]|uniref:Uncharacterized protein n=1 Tax=Hymenobacter qilianensis TaxID=1385715 RepID=A0ACB5PRK9_9BACT|nr:hypothetical protein GCM10011375_19850 [Hymenobacter qilianensis]